MRFGLGVARALTLATLVVVVAACGGDDGESSRPDVTNWEAVWTPLVEGVPAPPADQDACESYLAVVRQDRETVLPAPSEALDATVTEWIDKAEQLTFDCDEDAYADEFEQLGVIEEEINAGLAAL